MEKYYECDYYNKWKKDKLLDPIAVIGCECVEAFLQDQDLTLIIPKYESDLVGDNIKFLNLFNLMVESVTDEIDGNGTEQTYEFCREIFDELKTGEEYPEFKELLN